MGSTKLSRSVAGQRGAIGHWLDWASRQRTDGPLVWVHAASVGEGLAVEPIVRRLRVAMPDIQIAHTHSSPSVATWPGSFGADAVGFVPPDEPGPIAKVMVALRPSLMLFSRGDLWPELMTQAHERCLPVAVSGATVRPSSKRLKQPARTLFRRFYSTVAWVGAVSEPDAERYIRLGVKPTVVTVTGDPRHDQVIERLPDFEPLAPLMAWSRGKKVLVAGSTYPEDEAVLLRAFCTVRKEVPSAGLVLVPHDPPSKARSDGISLRAKHLGIDMVHWAGGPLPSGVSCVVVRVQGSLADAYACGDIAYVGGGFRPGRLHSTAEPAAYGIPLIVGPELPGAADAALLLDVGAAVSLPDESPVKACAAAWLRWEKEELLRLRTGLVGRSQLDQGGSRATLNALLPLIS